MRIRKRKERNQRTIFGKAIVRAYGDEPVAVEIRTIGPKSVEVAQPGGSASIRLPYGDIFAFDDVLLGRLQDAHGRMDANVLRRLWATAKPFTPPAEAAA